MLIDLVERANQQPSCFIALIFLMAGGWFALPIIVCGSATLLLLTGARHLKYTQLTAINTFLLSFTGCAVLWYQPLGLEALSRLHQESGLHTMFFRGLHWTDQAWLTSYPLGVIWGFSLFLLSRAPSSLLRDIERVARGQRCKMKRHKPASLLRKLKQYQSAAVKEGTLLGLNVSNGAPAILTDLAANLHVFVVGTTGAGKTTVLTNLIESGIKRNQPLFYIDGKGDQALKARLQLAAETQQRPFYCFDMLGNSAAYNPLASGGYSSKKDRLIELRHWSEDHYRKLAESYLQIVFKVLTACNRYVDLSTVAAALTPETLYTLIRQATDDHLIDSVDTIAPHYTAITSLVAEINTLVQSEIGHLFQTQGKDTLTFSRALKNNAIVYLGLQPLAFPAYARTLGKLMINDLKALAADQLMQPEAVRQKIWTIFDEFSVFAGDQIVHLVNQGRSAGLQAVLATQSLTDIIRQGDQALLGQILNNCNNFIILRQNNPQDAELLAHLIGTESSFDVTSQLSATSKPTLGSVRETKAFIVHPDAIKRLPRGEAIYLNKQNFNWQWIHLRQGL